MIKANIKDIAEKNNVTTAYQLQKLLNIQPSLAAKWYRNDLRMIGFDSLNSLCKAFNCLPSDILVYVADDGVTTPQMPVAASELVKTQSAPVSNVESVRRRLKENAPVVASNPADVSKRLKEASGKVFNNSILEIVNSSSDNEYVLTTAAAGELLNLSPRSVRENAEKGLLHGKQGKQSHWFFRRSDVDQYKARRGQE